MTVENIKSGELSTALTGIRLVLHFLGMAKQIGFGWERYPAFVTVIRSGGCGTAMASSVRSSRVGIALFRGNKLLVASNHWAVECSMTVFYTMG